MDCVFLNNILILILKFAYFPVTNSKGKIRFIGTLKLCIIIKDNQWANFVLNEGLKIRNCEPPYFGLSLML